MLLHLISDAINNAQLFIYNTADWTSQINQPIFMKKKN